MSNNAYQQVIAGRVREDEQIEFFGKNKVAVPGRVVSAVNPGGGTVPQIKKDYLRTEQVGKGDDPRTPVLDAYLPNSYNAAL